MSKFQRPPLSDREKEQAAQNFIEGAARSSPMEQKKKVATENKKVIFLRVPQSLYDDLERIHEKTGYKPNTFCLHAIIEAVKEKLKQIERDY